MLRVLSTPKAAAYDIPGHPEHPGRLLKTLQLLRKNLPPSTFSEPVQATVGMIQAVHSGPLYERVKREEFLDPDTPGAPGVFQASLLSCGAAMEAARGALKGEKVFSLMRPPGHHATPQTGMGFCYFNSMAVAAQGALEEGLAKRVAVLDLDCHHGNGTEAFFLGKSPFMYLSLHQFPAYPGTGYKSEQNCANFPLPPGTEGDEYFPAMDKALKKLGDFKPDLVGVSMGFDTYEKDPLTDFGLRKADYKRMGKALAEMGWPSFALLEGGYHDDLPYLVEEFLAGWAS